MIDVYFSSADEAKLRLFLSFFTNAIGPRKGSAAVEANPEADPPVEAEAARGDPGLYYGCLRLPFDQTFDAPIPEGIAIAPSEDGAAVIGVWA